ncbi:MAG: glycosyl hydrolase [Ignisphaera sp.]
MVNRELFLNPPKIFRGVPFWSINDVLKEEEISKQVSILDEAGFGGAFFHAREGLVTPFLSEEWFNSFEAAVEEALRRGMTIWIYDEDRWPSGFAGGYVPALSDRYRAKALLMIIDSKCFEGVDTVAMFRCKVSEFGLPTECERIYKGEAHSKYLYLTFVRYTAPIGDVWYSGFSYVDTLNPEAIQKFIDIAYKPYVDRFKSYIGSVIPGVFTDEPRAYHFRIAPTGRRFLVPPRGGRFHIFAIPWTDNFPEYFRRINKYDILDKLPELFFDIGDYTKTRYDFWKTITQLFLEAFTKQLYDWCDKHGLKFTGHLLSEDALVSQIVVGAAMPHYEYMHIPGIDHLGYQIWNSLLTVKQVASVANQLSRDRVMCETYGCLGNYPTFEDRKWIGDFLYALGVNMLVHHLVPYSMRGRRKADYGLNFHWGQPWWKYNRVLEDYFSRLSYVLSQGVRVAEVLVISPITSVWCLYTPLNVSKAKKIDEEFSKLLMTLLRNHIDFELGDEMILARYGRVDGRELVVGRVRYKAVIMPRAINITYPVLELLKRYLDSGGMVILVGGFPKYVDGSESPKVEELLRKALVVQSEEEAVKILKAIDMEVTVEGENLDENILIHTRDVDGSRVVFIANVSRDRDYAIKIGVKGLYDVELWDPFTGNITKYSGDIKNGRTWIYLTLKPVESRLFVLKPGTPTKGMVREAFEKIYEIYVKGNYKIRRRNPNILVLDFAQLSLNNTMWSDFKHLIRIREDLVSTGFGSNYKLRFRFIAEFKPKTNTYLVIENPSMYKCLRVNGVEIDLSKSCGLWIDWNFKKYDVTNLIKAGENIIEVEGVVTLEPEIEPMYILGDFAVKEAPYGESRIIPEVLEIDAEDDLDLCQYGYPFYSGEMELENRVYIEPSMDFDKAELFIEKLDAALALVYVNGFEAGKIIHTSRSSIDITNLVKKGENVIKIILVGTLRNTLGPLHKEDTWWMSPETFYTIDEKWKDHYVLRPFGLKGLKVLLYRKKIE